MQTLRCVEGEVRARLVPIGSMLLLVMGTACAAELGTETGAVNDPLTFEEFKAAAYLEPGPDGVYIVDGDLPAVGEEALHELFYALHGHDGALLVQSSGGRDGIWSAPQRHQLSYCVSDSFGTRKAAVVAAMDDAARSWEAAADITFVYASEEDARCDNRNTAVLFDVGPAGAAPYLARAFFPGQSRSTRNVLVANSAFRSATPLTGVIRHELGHVLGFLHEHIARPRTPCPEGGRYRALTEYDPGSVMHYPQCGGTNFRLDISSLDVDGAQSVYGPPRTDTAPAPTPTPTPSPGTPRSGSASGTLTAGQTVSFAPLAVLGGTPFSVSISGTGDADLYLRWDAAPTESTFDCRPFRSDSNETCAQAVPPGVTTAHLQLRGFTASSYSLRAEWTAP